MNIIKIDPSIKRQIAQAVVAEAHPGFSSQYMASHFVVNGNRVVAAEPNRQWDPWPDNANIIGVDYLVNEVGGARQDNITFGDDNMDNWDEDGLAETIEFTEGYVPDEYDQDEVDSAED